jgi:GNAT superfamily N-acetyltransferase
MTTTIRPARPGDEFEILRMIQALADYEREPDAVETTAEELRADLFADVPRMFAHVADQDGRIVGIAVWFLNFSTWTGRHGIYLEDLFVDPAVRGSGVAQGLIRALAAPRTSRWCATGSPRAPGSPVRPRCPRRPRPAPGTAGGRQRRAAAGRTRPD